MKRTVMLTRQIADLGQIDDGREQFLATTFFLLIWGLNVTTSPSPTSPTLMSATLPWSASAEISAHVRFPWVSGASKISCGASFFCCGASFFCWRACLSSNPLENSSPNLRQRKIFLTFAFFYFVHYQAINIFRLVTWWQVTLRSEKTAKINILLYNILFLNFT